MLIKTDTYNNELPLVQQEVVTCNKLSFMNLPVGLIWSRSFRVIQGLWGSCSGCTAKQGRAR